MKNKKAKKDLNHSQNQTSSKPLNKQAIITIACLAVLVLAHIAIIWAVIISWKYYDIYPSLFGSVVAIILCFLAIIDIIFFVGFNHMDLALKIVSSVLALLN